MLFDGLICPAVEASILVLLSHRRVLLRSLGTSPRAQGSLGHGQCDQGGLASPGCGDTAAQVGVRASIPSFLAP